MTTRMKQSGYASQVLLMGLFGLLLSMSLGMLRGENHARLNRADVERSAYLRDASTRLARWYDYNSGMTGAQAGQVDMDQALAEAGITPRFGLQAASSVRLSDGLVSWHVMALWLPEPMRVQGSALDEATGIFTQGTLLSNGLPAAIVHAVLDGHATQLAKFSESQRRVNAVALRLENMFSRLREIDPYMAEGRNWFRASNCADVQPGELSCYDGYRALTDTNVPASAGTSDVTNVNAWGGAIEASNLADSSITSPYSMSIRTTLPWGTQMRVVAQEP